ncbi:MAG: DNA-directed RNA polymerase subunit beta' [Spirochaetia bacterium]|nr:DNA-directed RNA polymerase subunit beta' [Spirochaetia bacterium]MDD5777801.1 DNA-directed RNA polymerase subunit beta' [Treponema sp.]MCI5609534.1 DNA-directed RNA polymerase subunit beta' [Spirochaetia bacterium]MCI6826187.1 DNA-directed RNA polymerase subunit beta' [Spirochaetia bacterium]MCI7110199.1 DNA-directed RNA polymerase subunit beta' [Spirochaetia bacterium]
MRDIRDFASLKIKLASPQTIHDWSYGEVKKPETINYRTLRPERDGLFDEKIFGTTKEWECYCGKFKSIRYKGVICDRCGVEVTHFKVRRERTGHIELAAPVSHIWYYRSVPSRMGLLLDLQVAQLRSVLYYEKYIVIDPGDTGLKKMELLTEDEYIENRERYGETFTAEMGAEAIKTLLEKLDLNALSVELRDKMKEKGAKTDKRLLKRIQIVEDFLSSGNKASWMILDVIPVIPPDLRPMVQLDGGRFATSDLNDLYRRVINRNNRLRRLQGLYAPDIIIRNEKRMLQEAVDALFDNTKRKKQVKGASNRPLKSISDMLKGKQGRFRQNLLGKRVDYSGRSVIVVGPEMKLWQCGLPTKMALELFKPFIIKKLIDKQIVTNIKKAKLLVERESPEVFAILDEVVKEHPVMLNRAPTLHRLGIQAFEPVLVEGKALKLHPLACKAFNADFDGDQMAIHVPLTQAAQMECWTLMLSARNLLDPANGKPIVAPSQDMVLGIYYMTSIKKGAKGTGKRFCSADEVRLAAESGAIEWNALIKVPAPKNSFKPGEFSAGDVIETSAGRLSFNESMPDEVNFVNEQMGDKQLKKMIEYVFHNQGSWLTIQMLDAIKACGYKNATFYGATLCMDDIIIPPEKKEIVEKANAEVEKYIRENANGHITSDERYNRVTSIWQRANDQLSKIMMEQFKSDKDGFNTIFMMADSGARGSPKQISQLAAMRGLMAKPNGDIIELPIRSNFKEGLSVIEYFISTNGARKGLSDTALKTADAGYMTRRLVDVAQDVVINIDDCGTINGIDYSAIKNGDEIAVHLADRIVGHYTIEDVFHPITGEIICPVNEYITPDLAAKIEASGVEKVKLRTVLTCEAQHGLCVKCYGQNLARNKIVEIGEAVGIIAAQSIGQPGTQLTLRTFHSGGTADKSTEDDKVILKYDAIISDIEGTHVVMNDGSWLFTRKGSMKIIRILDSVEIKDSDELLVSDNVSVLKDSPIIKRGSKEVTAPVSGIVKIKDGVLYLTNKPIEDKIANGSTISIQSGSVVKKGEPIGTINLYNDPIIAENDGYVSYDDIIAGSTLAESIDGKTGMVTRYISDLHLDVKQPRIIIRDEAGNPLGSPYYLPAGAIIKVDDKQQIKAGVTLAEIPKAAAKTNDITGGIPRVTELFEARKPKNPAVLARISGNVKFKGITKAKRVIVVTDDFGKEYEHLIPTNKHMIVRDGDRVKAGEQLCDGSPNPSDILEILGENALQNYLMDEILAVYRTQSVDINDKHIGIIIRQMLRKIEIVAVGDTRFIFGQQVDKYKFHAENKRIIQEGGQPAIGRPMFLGITKAALNVDSFISAASFQETTKVLTNAAISGQTDGLYGIKENVAIGHMIPAGTGIRNYKNVKLYDSSDVDLDAKMEEILAQRALEKEMENRAEEPVFEPEDQD